jgi:hypothetical protein
MPKEYNCTALHCTAQVHVVPQQILAKVCCRVPSPGNQGFGRQTSVWNPLSGPRGPVSQIDGNERPRRPTQ